MCVFIYRKKREREKTNITELLMRNTHNNSNLLHNKQFLIYKIMCMEHGKWNVEHIGYLFSIAQSFDNNEDLTGPRH